MLALLERAGFWGQAAFVLVVVGLPVLVGLVLRWWQRRDLVGPALAAARQARDQGHTPAAQYGAGRDAALLAASPPSGYLLRSLLLGWAGSLLVIALLNFLGIPSLEMVTDVLRGRVQLAPGQSASHFAAYIMRTLLAGSLSAMLAVPALQAAAVGFGFVRAWLLGSALDRALLGVIADIDAQGADRQLQAVARDLRQQAQGRWPVSAFLLGPFYWLGKSRPGRALVLLVAWLALLIAGLALWYLVARLVWDGQPLQAGTTAGVLWHHLREALVSLCVLPVFLLAAIRTPGTTPPDPARESAPAVPPPAP